MPTDGVLAKLATALESAGAPSDPRERFWSQADIAEFDAFRAGGPLPTSEGALHMVAIDCQLDWVI